ncbi:thioredoxin family protein [Elioraea sp.]|jgi:hypothetical protein|uniref:DUF1223 domain-containing protein n=1 Tax=Elioraea sp. TaxID=2185103 RepID=UPI0021DD51C1|nr:DUF1223 domain-containing protein [Elioraea sp.]GIX09511.1 MAG: coproporphyrinogen III oxidase [Elioraea sp.]
MARLLFVALALAVVALPRASSAGEERGPVVLELFTSQGCSACPPADRLLAKLARDGGVIALSFHVPYWDHMGWRDPFALPVSVQRQRGYARAMKERSIYTPQLVVQGAAHAVGHDRPAVERLIAAAPAAATIAVAVAANSPPVLAVSIPALDLPQGGAQLWLVAFTRTEARQVLDGENAGHLLRHTNVVRWAGPVAVIEAVPVELSLSAAEAEGADAVALLLQKPRQGPVLAAGQVALR